MCSITHSRYWPMTMIYHFYIEPLFSYLLEPKNSIFLPRKAKSSHIGKLCMQQRFSLHYSSGLWKYCEYYKIQHKEYIVSVFRNLNKWDFFRFFGFLASLLTCCKMNCIFANKLTKHRKNKRQPFLRLADWKVFKNDLLCARVTILKMSCSSFLQPFAEILKSHFAIAFQLWRRALELKVAHYSTFQTLREPTANCHYFAWVSWESFLESQSQPTGTIFWWKV